MISALNHFGVVFRDRRQDVTVKELLRNGLGHVSQCMPCHQHVHLLQSDCVVEISSDVLRGRVMPHSLCCLSLLFIIIIGGQL